MNLRKTFLAAITIFLFLSVSCTFGEETSGSTKLEEAPFTHGVNLTSWFESWNKTIPNLNLYCEQDFRDLSELGVDVVRIPIHFDMFEEDETTGTIKPIIFDYLDSACDWAEKYNIHLVIDDHSFNSGTYPSAKNVRKHCLNLWPQIVDRYKNRSSLIIYEILNEPQLSQNDWYKIQSEVITSIRKGDKKHTIVVTGSSWGSLDALSTMKPYDDQNLIYTFHYYDPFIFTHQGASWTSKEVEAAKNIPFPYDADRIPELTGAAKGSWVENSLYGDYKTQASEEGMRNQLMKAVKFREKYNVPVWVGEMGAYNLNSQYQDRVEWYKTTGKLFNELNLPFTVWGYGGSFGIFKKDSAEIYPYDLDEQIISGLGFNIPDHIGEKAPDDISQIQYPFKIYDDSVNKNLKINAWGSNKDYVFDLGASDNPPQGKYNISWGNAERYAAINIDFSKLDLSEYENNLDDKAVSFNVKFEKEKQQFQLRFVDTDSGDGIEKPWRLSCNVKASETGINKWVNIKIPLNDFSVTGAWCSKLEKWYTRSTAEPFDWTRVESLQFSAEDAAIDGIIKIDDIKIVKN